MTRIFSNGKPRRLAFAIAVMLLMTSTSFVDASTDTENTDIITGVQLLNDSGEDLSTLDSVDVSAPVNIIYTYDVPEISQIPEPLAPLADTPPTEEQPPVEAPSAETPPTNELPTEEPTTPPVAPPPGASLITPPPISPTPLPPGSSPSTPPTPPLPPPLNPPPAPPIQAVIQVPSEIDLSNVRIVSDIAQKTADNEITITPQGKGKLEIHAAFNQDIIGLGEKDIVFALGNGRTQTVKVKLVAEKPSLMAEDDVFDFFTSIELKKAGTGNTHEDLGENVTKDSAVRIVYKYDYSTVGGHTGDIPIAKKFTFTLPDKIQIKGTLPINITADSEVVASGEAASDGKVWIKFNENNGARKAGDIWFEANFNKDKIDNSGRQKILFEMNGSPMACPPEVSFGFDQIKAEVVLTKSGQADLTDKTIEWTITATPKITNALDSEEKFDSWTITDEITDTNLELVANSTSIDPTVNGGSFTETTSGGSPNKLVYTFPADTQIAPDTEYTIKFKTRFKMDAFGTDVASADFSNTVKTEFTYPQYKLDTDGKVTTDTSKSVTDTKPATGKVTIAAGNLTKEGSVSSAKEITWTIKVKNSLLLPDPQIVDTLPTGLTYQTGSATLDGAAITPTTSGQTITFTLAAGKADEQTIVYKTDVRDVEWNAGGTFTNNAVFSGSGTGPSITKTADVSLVKALLTKSGKYNRANHTITWTISLGKAGVTLKNVKVVDTIHNTLTYVENSLNAGGGTGSYDNRVITVDYSDDITGAKTITFDTTVNDAKYWATNDTTVEKFSNTVKLTATDLTPPEVIGTADVISEVLLKEKQGSYDVVNRLAEWKLTINQNKMAMKNVVVTDEIPIGWEFVETDFTDANSIVTSKSYDAASRKLTLNLNDLSMNSGPYQITYKMHLVDETLLQGNDTPTVTNTATITFDNNTAGASSTATQTIAKSVVTKTGKTLFNAIEWTVLMNNNLLELKNPELVDKLTNGLELDPLSVKLYRLELDANSDIISKTEETVSPDNIKLEDTVGGTTGDKTFTFSFNKTINKAYHLVFVTDITKNYNAENSIDFKGGSASATASSGNVKLDVSSSGGSTAGGKGKIEITKTDNNNKPLEGVEFQLGIKTVKTDVNGVATFENVKAGTNYTYDIVESKPLPGYTCDATNTAKLKGIKVVKDETTKITIENTLIEADVEFLKRGEGDVPLEGVEFDIFRHVTDAPYAHANAFKTTPKTDAVDGKATIKLPYGDYLYREVEAPAGYVTDSTLRPFTVIDTTTHQYKLVNKKPTLSPPPPLPPNNNSGGNSGGGGSSGGNVLNPPSKPLNPGVEEKPLTPETQEPTPDVTVDVTTPPNMTHDGALEAPDDSHYILVDPPESGMVVVNPDGTWEYTPIAGFEGEDSFDVEIQMPNGEKKLTHIIVKVLGGYTGKSPANTGKY